MRWSDELLAAASRLQAGMRFDVLPGVPTSGEALALDSAELGLRRTGLQREAVVGPNPARLTLIVYTPEVMACHPPLIVLLHGCQQDAARFAKDSGWIERARLSGAVLLLPEQSGTNNPIRCFSWFRVTEASSGAAELRSLREMIDTALAVYGCDPQRVFVVGLSAGGAMAAALMAAYPDVVAAGAVVAGLPVGCAQSMSEALGRMSNAGPQIEDDVWAERARAIGPTGYNGPWPRVSVWHGDADQTVDPTNGELLVRQWRALHAIGDVPTQDVGSAERIRQRTWRVTSQPVVEWWNVAGLDHGYPVAALQPAGRWVLPAQIDATDRIADFLGLGG